MKQNWDKIIRNFAYKCDKGYPDFTNPYHLALLRESLIKFGWNENTTNEFIGNLRVGGYKKIITERNQGGILDSSYTGKIVKIKGDAKSYTLTSNKFYKNLGGKLKKITPYKAYPKTELESGHIIELEDDRGAKKIIVRYSKKEITSKERPSSVGLFWADSSESMKMKPQDLIKSVLGKEVSASELLSSLKSTINNRSDLSMSIKEYLLDLANKNKVNIKKSNPPIEKSAIRQIEKNFGEIVGALHVVKSGEKIFFPGKGNYPLIDFMIIKKDGIDKYSSKGGSSSTNTLKTADLIRIINDKKEFDIYKSGQYTESFKIFNILKDNSVKGAPYKLADYFGIKYDKNNMDDGSERYQASKKSIIEMNKSSVIDKIQEIVNGVLSVNYIITTIISSSGMPKIIVKPATEIKVKFRDKNSKNSWKNKIGLAIK